MAWMLASIIGHGRPRRASAKAPSEVPAALERLAARRLVLVETPALLAEDVVAASRQPRADNFAWAIG